MDIKELETRAHKNEEIPQKISLVEKGYFAQLRDMYREFNSGAKTEDLLNACKDQKAYLLKEFNSEVDQKINEVHRYTVFQENIRLAGTLHSEINKTFDIKQICEKLLKIESLRTGDETFYTDNLKKIGDK